ncbi:hypothetical protein GUJ93_ZPchr0002g24412 [Zizania palustris]|uniref:Uncharacterized protein n=1 Tax=Zizania palustris TaxID=103762 RepID=A0A8J5S5F9_ZIZPA|nr:hypothetical protein GUJ93_ZPchr0002g24412 [Zizania palustris]
MFWMGMWRFNSRAAIVETLVEGDKLGVTPHTIRQHCADNSTTFLSIAEEGWLLVLSWGHSGHIDGKPSDAQFKRPTGIAVDHTVNVYVADTANLTIRKIGESDIILVIGAIVAGYIFSVVQHGFGSSGTEKIEAVEDEHQESSTVGKPPLVVESLKEEPSAGSWLAVFWDTSC